MTIKSQEEISNPMLPLCSTFVAWTQFVVTGKRLLPLSCSLKQNFPTTTAVSRQIA
jgi:hypothetical protein